MSENRRDQIVTAALEVFGRYGYRRSSMDLIAQAARISRPAVYQYFPGKEAVFRAVGQKIADEVLAAAADAGATGSGGVADRLTEVLAQKLDLFGGAIGAGFKAELFAEAGQLAGDVIASFHDRYADLVERIVADSGLPGLGRTISPRDVALVLTDALPGIAQEPDAATARRRLRQLVDLVVRGLSA
ncbi:helix-turn-helix domain-containing protein [Hamadaea sp. NPDC050747]|uniref:TetR/AcrR family transcriptional regulator n=1 Tax=Hamadaea sp. NPDC050747 TaxID=3155789 RepID=UPI0033FCA06B